MQLSDIRSFHNLIANTSKETLDELMEKVNEEMANPDNLKDSAFLNFAYNVLLDAGAE